MRVLFNNFLRGLLLVFPVFVTVYIIFAAVRWSNNTLNDLLFEWLNLDLPGLGILTVFLGISLIGYTFSLAFTRPLVSWFERFLTRVPFVKIIYSSLKELTEAFVGDKKRFNKPVLVDFGSLQVKRLGFITQQDLSEMNIRGMVAVYLPHSYNFTGNLCLVPEENVTRLDLNAAEVMKYVISGGITKISPENRGPIFEGYPGFGSSEPEPEDF